MTLIQENQTKHKKKHHESH